MVDKYLNDGERVIYELKYSVKLDDDMGFFPYLTDYRLIFLKRKGLIFKKDRMVDIFLKDLIGATMNEKGLIFKKRHLELRTPHTTMRVYGKDKHILDFHKEVSKQLMNFKK